MGLAKVGDKVVVVRTYAEYEEVYIGEVGTVTRVHDFGGNDDDVYEVKLEGGGIKEFYEDEVQLHARMEALDAYTETIDKPVIDEDLAHLSDGDQDLYHEIVTGLSQAIEMASERMRNEEPTRNLADIVPLNVETPSQDLEDAPIVTELRGHGESVTNGILQDGISDEQARQAMNRAIRRTRAEELEKAKEVYESAKRKYAELSADDGDITYDHPSHYINDVTYGVATHNPNATFNDGDIPASSMVVQSTDSVEHPSHYTQGRFETIEIIAHTVSGYTDGFTAHCVGTATKYLNRAPHKHATPLEDLKKAAKYLEFAIEHEEGKE